MEPTLDLYTRTDAGADPKDVQFYITTDGQAAYLYDIMCAPNVGDYRLATDDEILEYRHKHNLIWGIVGQYTNLFYNLALRYEPNEMDRFVLDICIPACIKCCKEYDLSIGQASFFTYLYRAIQGRFFNYCKSNSCRNNREYQYVTGNVGSKNTEIQLESDLKSQTNKHPIKKVAIDYGLSLEAIDCEQSEIIEFLRVVLSRVAKYHCIVLTLRYLKEMSYQELMFFLDCSKGSVKNKIEKAIIACRQIVDKEFGKQKYID